MEEFFHFWDSLFSSPMIATPLMNTDGALTFPDLGSAEGLPAGTPCFSTPPPIDDDVLADGVDNSPEPGDMAPPRKRAKRAAPLKCDSCHQRLPLIKKKKVVKKPTQPKKSASKTGGKKGGKKVTFSDPQDTCH